MPSEELSATEIVSRAFTIYSGRFVSFFTPFLATTTISELLNRVVRARFSIPEVQPGPDPLEYFRMFTKHFEQVAPPWALISILNWIVATLAGAIVVKYASDLMERRTGDFQGGLSTALSRLPSLLAVAVVTGILVFVGLLFFVVPGLILAIMFTLTVPVIVIEGRGALESLSRSRRLVSGGWWTAFLLRILVSLLVATLNLIGSGISWIFGPAKGVVKLLLSAALRPLNPIALTLLYYSMLAKERSSAPPLPPPQPKGVVRYCSHCGYRLPEDAVFCPHCGQKITS